MTPDDLAAPFTPDRIANLIDEHADICGCTLADPSCPVPALIAEVERLERVLTTTTHALADSEIERLAAEAEVERLRESEAFLLAESETALAQHTEDADTITDLRRQVEEWKTLTDDLRVTNIQFDDAMVSWRKDEAAVDAVRALHTQEPGVILACKTCGLGYPCATARALPPLSPAVRRACAVHHSTSCGCAETTSVAAPKVTPPCAICHHGPNADCVCGCHDAAPEVTTPMCKTCGHRQSAHGRVPRESSACSVHPCACKVYGAAPEVTP
jgi:hypothetical protein